MGITVETCHCTAGPRCFQMLSTNLVSVTLPYVQNFSTNLHQLPWDCTAKDVGKALKSGDPAWEIWKVTLSL